MLYKGMYWYIFLMFAVFLCGCTRELKVDTTFELDVVQINQAKDVRRKQKFFVCYRQLPGVWLMKFKILQKM